MQSMRAIARAAAWLVPLAATACLTDPAAPVDTGAPTALHVVTQTSPSDGDRTVRVEVYFLDLQEQRVELPVSPAEITVPANESVEQSVTTRLESCFAAGYTGEGGVFCPLRVHLVLLDDEGEQITEGFASVDVLPGQNPVTVPSISLVPASIGGTVVDVATGAGIEGASVSLYEGESTEGTALATIVTGSGGAYLFADLQPGTYTVAATAEGFTSETIGPIVVGDGASTGHDISLTPPSSISGVIVDATTGEGVPGANVALYAGDTTRGTPVATLVAGDGGAYLFPGVDPGTYMLVATSAGFFEAVAGPITVESGAVTTLDIVATPQPAEGQTRIVLTWGATPSDLDSYLFGPASADNYHVFYGNETAPPFANLDTDDTDSFGPETITITQQPGGRHIYAVHNYSNRGSTAGDTDPAGRMALANSGARVQVYRSGGLIAEFTVPTDREGTLWTVFALDGDTVTPINAMSFVGNPDISPPAGVASTADGDGATLSRTRAAKRTTVPPR